MEVPQWSGKWVVSMDEYKPGVVGAKSKNLAGLRGKLPGHIQLPASVTLPFGCFEKVWGSVGSGGVGRVGLELPKAHLQS